MATGVGKAKQRQSSKTKRYGKYTSKGERPNVTKSTLKGVKRDQPKGSRMINQQKAWLEGKNVVLDKDETGKKITALQTYGDSRYNRFRMDART